MGATSFATKATSRTLYNPDRSSHHGRTTDEHRALDPLGQAGVLGQ
jgi:hypothetical protein